MSKTTRYIALIVTLAVVVGVIIYLESFRLGSSVIEEEATIEAPVLEDELPEAITEKLDQKKEMYMFAKEIVRPSGYVNSDPFQITDYIGKKVILLDFMTYSCINCQRTWPYLNAWNEKYNDQGLQILGIHTPEFDFEKDIDNVEKALAAAGIKFPVVLDNEKGTWRAYQNRYWPRKYIIDIDGYVVYNHIGEGSYDETEEIIRDLLEERIEKLALDMELSDDMAKPENVEKVSRQKKTPEIYFGAGRNRKFLGNGRASTKGKQTFEEPTNFEQDMLYLVGKWDVQTEFAETLEAGTKVILPYKAAKVFLVGSAEDGAKMTVLKDGEEIQTLEIQDDKLYRLIEDEEFGKHTLELVFDKPGVKVFTFTFG